MSDDSIQVKVVVDTGDLTAAMAQVAAVVTQAVNQMSGSFAALSSKLATLKNDLKDAGGEAEKAGEKFNLSKAITESTETAKKSFETYKDLYEKVKGFGELLMKGSSSASSGGAGGAAGGMAAMAAGGEAAAAMAALVAAVAVVVMEFKLLVGWGQTGAETMKRLKEDSEKLAGKMGVSVTEASKMRVALGHLGVDSATYGTAVANLDDRLKNNEAALKKMGVATRDANGHLLTGKDVIPSAAAALETYREGTDRNEAAQYLFGMSLEKAGNLTKLSAKEQAEAKKRAEELGLVVGKENVEAYEAYDQATNDASQVLDAMKKVMGEALMPVLTNLANFFAQNGPEAVQIFRDVVTGVMDKLNEWSRRLVTFCVNVEAAFKSIYEVVSTSGSVIGDVFSGNISKAIEDGNQGIARLKQIFSDADAVKKAIEEDDKKPAPAHTTTPTEEPSKKGKHFPKPAHKVATGTHSTAPVAPAAKAAAEGLAEGAAGGVAEAAAKAAEDALAHQRDLELAGIDLEEDAAKKRKELGNLTQTQLLEMQIEFEDRRNEARRKTIKKSEDLDNLELEHKKKVQELRQALESEAQTRDPLADLGTELGAATGAKNGGKTGREVFSSLSTGLTDLVTRAKSFKQVMDEMYKSISKTLVQNVILNPLKEQLASWGKSLAEDLGISLGGDADAKKDGTQEKTGDGKDKAKGGSQGNSKGDSKGGTGAAAKGKGGSTQGKSMQGMALGDDAKTGAGKGGGFFKDIEDAMTNMTNRTRSFKQNLQATYQAIGKSFIQHMVVEPMKQYVASLAKMLLQKLGFLNTNNTAEGTASTTSVSTKGAEATAVVEANAAEAASGAAASQAAIPFAGWALAGTAFAATLALVLGAKSGIKSASGGYDIPAGVNPLTQLHEQEMVLPAKYANVIRGMSEGDGSASAGGATHVHVHATDAKSVERLLMSNDRTLARALAKAARNGVRA